MGEVNEGGPGPEGQKSEKESTFNQVYQRWVNMNPYGGRSMVGTDEYRQVRQEVVNKIENVYQKFLEENGPVSGVNLRDFFTSWIGLVDFVTREGPDKELSVSHYELGYRFIIDALLNSEERLSHEERETFRQYFMDRAPCYNHLEFHSEERDRAFLKSYPRKENFQEAVSLLCKKSEMFFYLAGTHPPSSIRKEPDWRDLVSSQLEPAFRIASRGRWIDTTKKFDPEILLGGLIYQIAGENMSKYEEIRTSPPFQLSDSEFLDKVRADFEVDQDRSQ